MSQINDRIEVIILKNLLYNEEYSRRVLPFIKDDYFTEVVEKTIFQKIYEFIITYDSLPTTEAILISVNNDKKIPSGIEPKIKETLMLFSVESVDMVWLLNQTEEWCKDRAIYNALLESIQIADDKGGKLSRGSIPTLLTSALAVSFDPSIGHDYFNDSDQRYDFYNTVEERLPFDLKYLNMITNGGVPKKTLNVLLAGTAVGKSLALCHMAASYLLDGRNVLYITLEMAEEKIAERIDANLLNVPLSDLQKLSRDVYQQKMTNIRKRTLGKLLIKEYPTASVSVTHFRSLLDNLNLKLGFSPDVIIIDYLNIAASARLNNSNSANSYLYVKSIAEEFRGLGVEYNVPIWTATQTNRQGFVSSDIGLENTAESFGLPATADFMLALISTEELEKVNQILIKQLKNRYNDVNRYRRFVVGIDKSKMRLFDVNESAQKALTNTNLEEETANVFDKSQFGQGMKSERKFDDFKF